jgi:glycosyltransferase involved in cell wall biosynthesis
MLVGSDQSNSSPQGASPQHAPPARPGTAAAQGTPRISVIISSYNNRRFVAKKLDEIRAQTLFHRAEFLLVETASPERERDLFEPFCREHPNAKLIALDERKTLFEAWNLGWENAGAPLVCYSNMDDMMHPELLERVVAAFEVHDYDLCSVLISKQPLDAHWNDWSLDKLRKLPLGTRPGPFTAWKRGIDQKIGGRFDPRFIAAGDKDFWSRAEHCRLKAGLVKKVLYLYSKSPDLLSTSNAVNNCKAVDDALFREKPYPQQWPKAMKWQVILTRSLFRWCPSAFVVPL